MTVEEMKEEIKNKCINTDYDKCCLCPLHENKGNCYEGLKSEEIKRNYELMFGKEESKMKNEFDFNELKAGYAIKTLDSDELIIGVQMEQGIIFFNKHYTPIISKKNIVNNTYAKNFEVLEVYGFSNSNFDLFDPSTRPLLWKKEEDMNFKIYKIGNLKIKPNYCEKNFFAKVQGYKTEQEDFLFIENISSEDDEYITINKSEFNGLINALTEIRDFIEDD